METRFKNFTHDTRRASALRSRCGIAARLDAAAASDDFPVRPSSRVAPCLREKSRAPAARRGLEGAAQAPALRSHGGPVETTFKVLVAVSRHLIGTIAASEPWQFVTSISARFLAQSVQKAAPILVPDSGTKVGPRQLKPGGWKSQGCVGGVSKSQSSRRPLVQILAPKMVPVSGTQNGAAFGASLRAF